MKGKPLCTGLCVGQTHIPDSGLPLKASLSAWPSSVLPTKSNVTIRCKSPTPSEYFILKKEGHVFDIRKPYDLTEDTAEFYITELQQGYGGRYTCEPQSKWPNDTRTQPSDPLLLLVTGYLPRPSLQAHQWGPVVAGSKVTLQCLRTDSMLRPIKFALLKEGHSSPLQMSSSTATVLDFSLEKVTARDSGKYTCVYFQARPPFRTSVPSNPLEVSVTDAVTEDYGPPDNVTGYVMGNLIRIGVAAVIVLILGGFLVEAWHSQRLSPNRPWLHNAPGDQ
ncbi:T-cell-interacting, activating receptor on myeloid cells protein 1 isoform X2 [Mesocricetus auratus]|uniref:T-cell-interacting, activating receptor on myeloid cells protein 1 isoform X2 n=1 Tax=Mesocricetus auratus TaxID=10036 RepID=UPI001AF01FD5|nr:T-cell-interacting, activating receptor on myeloid cells protein 1 isoform X2 [Mesocricetus auratus]